MLVKQFWDTLNIGPDTKRLIYEGKKKKIMIPSAEPQDDIYDGYDDNSDDDFMDDLSYESQPKAIRPVPVLQPKVEKKRKQINKEWVGYMDLWKKGKKGTDCEKKTN